MSTAPNYQTFCQQFNQLHQHTQRLIDLADNAQNHIDELNQILDARQALFDELNGWTHDALSAEEKQKLQVQADRLRELNTTAEARLIVVQKGQIKDAKVLDTKRKALKAYHRQKATPKQ